MIVTEVQHEFFNNVRDKIQFADMLLIELKNNNFTIVQVQYDADAMIVSQTFDSACEGMVAIKDTDKKQCFFTLPTVRLEK